MVQTGLKKYREFLAESGTSRAFILGCVIFVVEMLYLLSMQSVFAEDRFDVLENRNSRPLFSDLADPNVSSPRFPVSPESPASASAPVSPNTANATGTRPPQPTTDDSVAVLGDLGAQIKYCIVFPFLNSAGEPIPQFDVPECPNGPPPQNAPRLTIVKVVINDDKGAATTTDFALFVGSTRVQSGVERSYLAGTYIVSEATTTVIVGTTTMRYTQEFDGGCDTSGVVVLSPGDVKTCTIINDDPGAGGQGGEGDGGGNGGGNGGGGNGGGGNGGGPSSLGSSSGGGGGGSALFPSVQIAGASIPEPEFIGGFMPEPGAPNAGSGGRAQESIGLLVFSFASMLFGLFQFRISVKSSRG